MQRLDYRDVFIATIILVDSDSDSLEDGWELLHFGSLVATGDGDDNGDGIGNAAEYNTGTDPKVAGSTFRVVAAANPFNSENLNLSWNGQAGQSYEIEFKDTFGTNAWQALPDRITAFSSRVTTTVAHAATRSRFYRVRVAE